MNRKPNPKYATPEDLASFAAAQIRTNLRNLAEIRALRHVLTVHIANVLTDEAKPSTPEEAAKQKEAFIEQISGDLDHNAKKIFQRLLELAEDESPETAALLDPREIEDIDTDP